MTFPRTSGRIRGGGGDEARPGGWRRGVRVAGCALRVDIRVLLGGGGARRGRLRCGDAWMWRRRSDLVQGGGGGG